MKYCAIVNITKFNNRQKKLSPCMSDNVCLTTFVEFIAIKEMSDLQPLQIVFLTSSLDDKQKLFETLPFI